MTNGEIGPGNVVMVFELPFHDRELFCGVGNALFDLRHVPVLLGCSDQSPENREEYGIQGGFHPVQPLIRQGAGLGVFGTKRAETVASGEVANNGIGFPQKESVIV